eukprot:scaffold7346_cov245-Pinguiococcus_pyrenoidosus.AAC.44
MWGRYGFPPRQAAAIPRMPVPAPTSTTRLPASLGTAKRRSSPSSSSEIASGSSSPWNCSM